MKYNYANILMFVSSSLWVGCGDDAPSNQDDEAPEASPSRDASARDTGARDTSIRDTGSTDGQEDEDAGLMPRDARTAPPGDTGNEACADVDQNAGGALHQDALEVLAAMTPCGFSACHAGRGKAGLTLLGTMDLRALLVDQPACEAPALSLVDGSGGAEALANSWLWRKLTSDVDAQSALPQDASWGTPGSCGQQPDQPYGLLMPLDSSRLSEQRLEPIRAWICAGAPGP